MSFDSKTETRLAGKGMEKEQKLKPLSYPGEL